MTENPTRITEDELTHLARRALGSFGLGAEDAAAAASILVLADLFGVNTHGTARILSYGKRLEIGGINAHLRSRQQPLRTGRPLYVVRRLQYPSNN